MPTSATDAAAQEPAAAPSDEERPAECVSLVEEAVASDAYAKGLTRLTEARSGEHYESPAFEEAIGALKNAAEQGHRAAQSLYGRTLFGVMFTMQAPTEQEREDYVTCFMFLRIAALRGDTEAGSFLPGLTEASPPATHEPPFDQIPAEWLSEAFERADAWMDCHGPTVGDRGATEPSEP